MHADRARLAAPLFVAVLAACGGIVTLGETDERDENTPRKDGGTAEPSDSGTNVEPEGGGACPDALVPACGSGVVTTAIEADGCPRYRCELGAVDAGGAPIPCTAAGGDCVGLAPTSCQAPNRVGDATQYSCGAGVGLQCCLDSCPEIEAPPPDYCQGGANIARKDIADCSIPACRFTLDESTSTNTVVAHLSDEIVVVRGGEGTGGYQWAVSQAGALPAPTETIAAGGGVGGGATRTFVWRDLPSGDHTVVLKHWRSFNGQVAATQTLLFRVQ